jgi:hypothetical protein
LGSRRIRHEVRTAEHAVTLFVQKSLAAGPIRFGVNPRAEVESIDSDPSLSTGSRGEFIRRSGQGYFYAANVKPVGAPELPKVAGISSIPFWTSVVDGTPRGWGLLAMLVVGALLLLLGFLVVATKGPQGWIEVILGIALIATPIVLTAQRRQQIRQQEERDRLAREDAERRNRAMLAAWSEALERASLNPTDVGIEDLARERQALDLPYELWSPSARAASLRVGFEHLAKVGPERSAEVAALMDRISRAAGLEVPDELGAKHDLYRALVWHLLADDRYGESQMETLKKIRKGFEIWDRDVPAEAEAAGQFRRLRGLTRDNLPRSQCPIRLAFRESCIVSSRGHLVEIKRDKKTRIDRLIEGRACSLYLTNKRVVIEGRSTIELPLPKVDDIEVDADTNVVTMASPQFKDKPLRVRLENPIFVAALIELAVTLNERPRGFA